MKSFKYTINGNVYKVHINSVVDDIADVEVNGTPYQVKLEKPAKKQMVTLKRPLLRLRYQVLSCRLSAT